MKWLKRLYQKYTTGAKANDFPIAKCGLFGGKLKNPTNLIEAFNALDVILSPEDKVNVREWGEDRFVAASHHSLGRWLRNNWGLWRGKNKLCKWFKSQGISHPDDMSGIILTSYHRVTNNRQIKLQEQIRHYQEYWAKAGETL